MRRVFLALSVALLVLVAAIALVWPPVLWSVVVIVPLILRGVADMLQTRQAVRRNFPLICHFRYLLEQIRPEINQYCIESNSDGRPFSRYHDIYTPIEPGALLTSSINGSVGQAWNAARPDRF